MKNSNGDKTKYPVIKGATAKDVFTIPNALSVVRILLIPLIFYLYLIREDYVLTAVVLAVSYLSDLADGVIARKFNMISNIGKILDPFADKLTQASMLVCIALSRSYAWILFALLAAKELLTAIAGYFAVRRTGVVSGAKWYGKVCTVALNMMFALLLFFVHSESTAYVLMIICGGFMIVSTAAYVIFFTKNYDGDNAPSGSSNESDNT